VASESVLNRRSGRQSSGRGRPPGGSERKQAAIVDAALDLFLREGFARASVDAIAAAAGVSKRTIYNHYQDKESLFLSVVGETYDSMIGAVEHLMERYLTDLPDDAVEPGIVAFAVEAALFAANAPRRSAMIRLMMAEAPHFPQLVQVQLRPRGITGVIADRLTRLDARGLLDVPEPVEAANHLFALTMGQMNNRTMYGSIPLDDAEITRMATSGARAFLRAYRPR
jgi:TetR/AcrR family transcriptional regulator, mexJK operon transcriptional repressor